MNDPVNNNLSSVTQQVDLTNIYVVVGAVVIMNIGGLGTFLFFLMKLVWYAAKYDSRIEKMELDLRRAFSKIKIIESKKEEEYE